MQKEIHRMPYQWHMSHRAWRYVMLALVLCGVGWFAPTPQSTSATVAASGDVTGTVFQDFNSNGLRDTPASTLNNNAGSGQYRAAIDLGVAGIAVAAYDASDARIASATSAADGSYTLTGLTPGTPYRVEFSIPSGSGLYSGPVGSSANAADVTSGSAVQFVSGGATSVNFGVNRPYEYCQNNPDLVTNCFLADDQVNGPQKDNFTIYHIPYSAGSSGTTAASIPSYDKPAKAGIVQAKQVGSTWGLAYGRGAQRLYASAFMKKHSGFGPGADGTVNTADDPGAVYIINRANQSVVATFTVPGAPTNAHDLTRIDRARDNDNIGWDAVGKTSLGGMTLSEDGTRLYVMNLENRTLYAYNLDPLSGLPTGAQPAALQTTPGVPAITGSAATAPRPATANGNSCAVNDVRPFAVSIYRGQLYAGVICSAESTQQRGDLWAYVYRVDQATLAFDAAPAFAAPLDYPRGFADDPFNAFNGQAPANWLPWSPVFKKVQSSLADGYGTYPQPMLTDIAFDNGNMILALRDRSGDQFGYQSLDRPLGQPGSGVNFNGVPAGDTLRACPSAAAGWALERDGKCNGVGPGPQPGYATQGPGSAPSGGEYYFRDEYGVGAQRNHDEVSVGGLTQIPGFPDVVASVYDPIPIRPPDLLYEGGMRWWNNTTGDFSKGYRMFDRIGSPEGFFGKANGMGDLIALCDSAPVEIGNRVWRDDNHDGIQQPGEPPLPGVTVQLTAPNGTVIATTTTDQNGNYLFSSTTTPTITPNTPGFQVSVAVSQTALTNLTPTVPNAGGAPNDSRDSDATVAGSSVVVPVTTGAPGANDHTYDIGFFPNYSIGNLVWFDTNNDGQLDTATERGTPGVTVSLFAANASGTPTGAALATVTTDASGHYRFDGLGAGTYVVRVDPANFAAGGPLKDYLSSSPTPTEDSPNNNSDSDDNGLDNLTPASGGVQSGVVTLGPTGVSDEPTGAQEPDRPASYGPGATTGSDAADTRSNLTVDFGFYQLAINGTVWVDTNNNGTQDQGEPGVPAVTITLIDSITNPITTTTTLTNGQYLFPGLSPGTYTVEITPPPSLTTPTGITTATVTLVPGVSPVVNPAIGGTLVPVTFPLVSPTALTMLRLSATREGGGVVVRWATGAEQRTFGFRIYRSASGQRADATELTTALIPARGADASGASYSWTDARAAPNIAYTYWVVEVSGDGLVEYGPIRISSAPRTSVRLFLPLTVR